MKESDIRNKETLDRYLELVREDCRLYFNDIEDIDFIPCPACHSKECDNQFTKNGFHYVTCRVCDTLFVANRPDIKQFFQFYAESESTHYWINSFFMPFLEARREKIFKPRVEWVHEYFGNDQGWMVGDVGAGFGLFLEELKKKWPQSHLVAIEPSVEQADICRGLGLDVECCLMEDLEGYDGTFDLLTAFELFEHLHQPSVFVEKIYRLLKPGGRFYMTTLNGHGFDIQVLWERAKAVTPPHHLNFLNIQSLSGLLERCGFKIETVETPGKLDWDIAEGIINEAEKDPRDRFWRILSREGSPKAKQDFQHWITHNNFSSHMRVLAVKK